MTLPCESKDDINDLKKAVSAMGNNGNKLENALIRMADAHEKQAAEIREMTQTITAHMMDNREFRISLERSKEERDILFKEVRSLAVADTHLTALHHNQELKIVKLDANCQDRWDVLSPLPKRLENVEKFHNRLIGGFVIIPGFFTFLSLCVAVYVAMKGG